MSNPLPPKHSMFWEDHPYTHDAAVSAFEEDGSLSSLNQISELPSTHLDGLPPENSMYWEGATEKIEPVVETKPELVNLAKPEQEAETVTAHFFPVRYAIDELTSDTTSPFGLPENWQGNGQARLDKSNYTLRQLRDGWLYVYDSINKSLDEYEIKGNEFTYYKLTETEDIETETRGSAEPPSTYLSYPSNSVLSLCFAPHRWTWKMFLKVLNNPESHIGRMQTVVLCDNPNQHHIAPIEVLNQVADIEASSTDDARFAHSCVVTQEDEAQSEIKPIASESDICGAIPEDEQAYVVAINDYLADINDMALHFVGVASPLRLFNEQTQSQRLLMNAAMNLCMFGASDSLESYPSSVKRRSSQLEFYQDMAEYFDATRNSELMQDAVTSVRGGTNAFTMQHTQGMTAEATKLSEAIKEKYRISDTSFPKYETWVANERWRKQLNWQQMLKDMREIAQHEDKLLEEVVVMKRDFIAILETLSPHHLERIVDLFSEETQKTLYQLHLTTVQSFTLVIQDEDRQWAEQQWRLPTSLWALYTSGFSRSTYKALESMLPISQQSPDEAEGSAVDNVMSWISTTNTVYGKIMDFVSNPNTQETLILKELSKGSGELAAIFTTSMKAAASGAGEQVLSASSQLTALIMNVVSQQDRTGNFVYRAVIAERMASFAGLDVVENYAERYRAWLDGVKNNSTKLKDVNAVVNAFHANDNTVSSNQYQKALEKQRSLKKSQQASMLEYPHRIELPENLATEIKAVHRDVINNKLDNLNQRFQKIGGLGFLGFLFNVIALKDAVQGLQQTGLLSEDDWLDLNQKLFYVSSAWAGIATGKAWGAVQGDSQLRARSLVSLKQAAEEGAETSLKSLKSLRHFNRWLSATAGLGMLASGIEAYRSWKIHDSLHGIERFFQTTNTITLTTISILNAFQFFGATTGFFSANVIFGGPMMGALLMLTIAYLFSNFILDEIKQDDYQKWLDKLPWGRHPDRQLWSESSDIETAVAFDAKLSKSALLDLQVITQKPIVCHQRMEKTRTAQGWQDNPKTELYALVLKIQVPKEIPIDQIDIRANLSNSRSPLLSGQWLLDAKLESNNFSTKESKRYNIYQAKLPTSDSEEYISLRVSYHNSDSPIQKQDYYFQHSVKQSAIYTAITDNSKQRQLESILSPKNIELTV